VTPASSVRSLFVDGKEILVENGHNVREFNSKKNDLFYNDFFCLMDYVLKMELFEHNNLCLEVRTLQSFKKIRTESG